MEKEKEKKPLRLNGNILNSNLRDEIYSYFILLHINNLDNMNVLIFFKFKKIS